MMLSAFDENEEDRDKHMKIQRMLTEHARLYGRLHEELNFNILEQFKYANFWKFDEGKQNASEVNMNNF